MLPGVTNLATMNATARQQADMVNSQFCTDAEINGYLNASYYELYNLIVQTYGDNYKSVRDSSGNGYQLTTDGIKEMFALPDGSASFLMPDGAPAPAFFKGLGVDLWISSVQTQPQQWFTLHRFNLGERNRYTMPNSIGPWGYIGLKYRYEGDFLWLKPLPQAGQLIQLRYAPRLTPLSAAGTIALASVIATNTVTINGVVLTGSNSMNVGTQFQTGGGDSVTATNLAACITRNFPLLPATSNSTTVTVTPSSGTVVWSASATMTLTPSSPWSYTADLVSGWEEYIVVDTTIKMKVKQEDDVSAQMARKADLRQQIEAAAAIRDAGEPQTVVDAYAGNGDFGGGMGSGGFY